MDCQPKTLCLLTLIICFLIASTQGGTVAVYWGQGPNEEGTLRAACKTKCYSHVILAFLDSFGVGRTPVLNLDGHCSPSNGTCKSLTTDIKFCQSKGIKVFISLGGSIDNYYLSSPEDAKIVAQYLWNNYLGGTSNNRPLGSAVLDGIDFDLEQGGGYYYDYLAKYLSAYSTKKRKVYLSAAPKCLYPDLEFSYALSTGLFDYVWVKFYNKEQCEYKTGNASNLIESWNTWISKVNATKFFVGLPAAPAAAKSGYIPPTDLKNRVFPVVKKSKKYGGIMLWNRYYDVLNNYCRQVKPFALEDPVEYYGDTLGTSTTDPPENDDDAFGATATETDTFENDDDAFGTTATE